MVSTLLDAVILEVIVAIMELCIVDGSVASELEPRSVVLRILDVILFIVFVVLASINRDEEG